jgi:type IV secretion system protein TrbL
MTRLTQSAVVLLAALYACPVFAEIPDSGLLNDVTDRFLTQSSTWGGVITGYATRIFWLLALISMVWTFGLMALRKADIGEFFAEFARFTVTTGFFWWLLSNGPAMAMAVINSLRAIGAEAGGLPAMLSPSTPISIGFDIVKKAFVGLSWVHPIDNLGIVLISAALVVAMAVVAANILNALVTAWAMAYAGVFILGFGGARWTSDMAIGYFKAMLGIGLELMTMTLLVAVAVSVVDGFYHALDGSSVYELLLVLCVCVVLALLINKIPARVAALSGGGSGAGLGAGTVIGGGAMAAAALATGGAALAAGAANAAGGAQALMAAFSKANAAESAGGGASALQSAIGGSAGSAGNAGSALAAAMGDGGTGQADAGVGAGTRATGDAGAEGGVAAKASTASTSSKADAITRPASAEQTQEGNTDSAPGNTLPGARTAKANGSPSEKLGTALKAAGAIAATAGKVAAGTAGNLAVGSWDVAKAKLGAMKSGVLDRIGETTGGKIAAAITARGAAEKSTTFGEDSLSAGSESLDRQSEVAAFRDRS